MVKSNILCFEDMISAKKTAVKLNLEKLLMLNWRRKRRGMNLDGYGWEYVMDRCSKKETELRGNWRLGLEMWVCFCWREDSRFFFSLFLRILKISLFFLDACIVMTSLEERKKETIGWCWVTWRGYFLHHQNKLNSITDTKLTNFLTRLFSVSIFFPNFTYDYLKTH